MQAQGPVTVNVHPHDPDPKKVTIEVKVVQNSDQAAPSGKSNQDSEKAKSAASSWRHNVIPETEMFWKPPNDDVNQSVEMAAAVSAAIMSQR